MACGCHSSFDRSTEEIRVKSKRSRHNWFLPLYFRLPCSAMVVKKMDSFWRSIWLPKVFKIGSEIKNGASGLWWRIAARIIPGLVPKHTGIQATCVVMTSPPTPRKRNDCFSNLIDSPVGNCCAMACNALIPMAVLWHPVSMTETEKESESPVPGFNDDVKENNGVTTDKLPMFFDSRGVCEGPTPCWDLCTCIIASWNAGEKRGNSMPMLLILPKSSAIHTDIERAFQIVEFCENSRPSTCAHQQCEVDSLPPEPLLDDALACCDVERRGHSRCQWPTSPQDLHRVTRFNCSMSRLTVLPPPPQKELLPPRKSCCRQCAHLEIHGRCEIQLSSAGPVGSSDSVDGWPSAWSMSWEPFWHCPPSILRWLRRSPRDLEGLVQVGSIHLLLYKYQSLHNTRDYATYI